MPADGVLDIDLACRRGSVRISLPADLATIVAPACQRLRPRWRREMTGDWVKVAGRIPAAVPSAAPGQQQHSARPNVGSPVQLRLVAAASGHEGRIWWCSAIGRHDDIRALAAGQRVPDCAPGQGDASQRERHTTGAAWV
jgi:hypothetical protein